MQVVECRERELQLANDRAATVEWARLSKRIKWQVRRTSRGYGRTPSAGATLEPLGQKTTITDFVQQTATTTMECLDKRGTNKRE